MDAIGERAMKRRMRVVIIHLLSPRNKGDCKANGNASRNKRPVIGCVTERIDHEGTHLNDS